MSKKISELDAGTPTVAALLAFAEGGATESVSLEDAVALGLVHGELYVAGGATAQGLTTSLAKLTLFAVNGISTADMTPDHTDDSIAITNAGNYLAEFTAVITSDTSNWVVTLEFHLDGVTTNRRTSRKIATGSDVGNISFFAGLAVSAGDLLTVHVKADAGTPTLTISDGTLFAERL